MTLGQVFAKVQKRRKYILDLPEIAKESIRIEALRDTLLKGANGMKSSSSKILMY